MTRIHEKSRELILIRVGLSIQESGREGSDTGEGSRTGLMGLSMMGTGRTEELMARARLLTLMETCIEEIGLMIRPMAMAGIAIRTELLMRGTGRMISRMGQG